MESSGLKRKRVATPLSLGAASITIPANSLAVGTDTLKANYNGDLNYAPATGTSAVTVPNGGFSISGTAVSIVAGTTSGNSSTVTVTPLGGFTGQVNLSAGISSSPTGGVNPPFLSFGSTATININGQGAATAPLTITTWAPAGCSQTLNTHQRNPFLRGGPITLAFLIWLFIPRRRNWRNASWIVLLLFVAALVNACGGGGGSGTCSTITPGTTPGTYTISVTGSDGGSLTAKGTINLTVQ